LTLLILKMWRSSAWGPKPIANIDRGNLTFGKIETTLFFLPPRGGQTPLPTSIGVGAMARLAPWIRHWLLSSHREGAL